MAGDYQTTKRMADKRKAIPLPDLQGKLVLDVGCDHGYWCKLASDMGAARVVGLDRGRAVRGEGFKDLVGWCNAQGWKNCQFFQVDLGKAWPYFGVHDVVFAFSIYHHLFQAADGDHDRIWRWFRLHTGEVLLWEGPLSTKDPIARDRARGHHNYTPEAIMTAAAQYFTVQVVGPAIHRPHREVLRCVPRSRE